MDKRKIGIAIGGVVFVAMIAICVAAFGGKKDDAETAAAVETAATAEPTSTPEVATTPEPTEAPTAASEPTPVSEMTEISELDDGKMAGETITVSGIEFKLDSTGGAYDNYGDYWTKEELADFEVKQKELAELDKANRANQNTLDETNESRVTHEEAVDFVENDLHIKVNE